MAQWNRQFKALGIPFLRSAASAHPDPIDGQVHTLSLILILTLTIDGQVHTSLSHLSVSIFSLFKSICQSINQVCAR